MKSPVIRNAFVLGAGLGTRLLTLTAKRPKPLIPIFNKPLITFAFDHLIQNGINRLVVNTHHCAEQYAAFFPENKYRDVPLHFCHEPALLETAGGIKNAGDLLMDAPFLVYNGDVFCDLPVERAVEEHFRRGNEVTLVLRSEGGPLHIALNPATGRVIDIAERIGVRARRYLFTGIYVVNPEFLARIPAETKISVIPIFMQMIQAGEKIGGIVIDEGHWWDLGTREKYLEIHQYIAGAQSDGFQSLARNAVATDARISPGAVLEGATAVGAGSRIGEGATLRNCVVWEEAEISPGSHFENCIITSHQRAGGTHLNADF
jgi:mannose-1-phosphate guanylyltransferase